MKCVAQLQLGEHISAVFFIPPRHVVHNDRVFQENSTAVPNQPLDPTPHSILSLQPNWELVHSRSKSVGVKMVSIHFVALNLEHVEQVRRLELTVSFVPLFGQAGGEEPTGSGRV